MSGKIEIYKLTITNYGFKCILKKKQDMVLGICIKCNVVGCKIKKEIVDIYGDKRFYNFCSLCHNQLDLGYKIIIYYLNVKNLLPENFQPLCCSCKRRNENFS